MAAAAAAIPAFALGPALANNGIIDYSTSEGINIYSAATSSTLVEDPLFDCEAVTATLLPTVWQFKKRKRDLHTGAIKKYKAQLCLHGSKQTKTADQKPGGRGSRPNTGEWAWKDVAPLEGEPTTQIVGGKTYHWCPRHVQSTIHSPEDCHMPEGESSAAQTAAQALAAAAIADNQGNIFHDLD
jgi:hypothetical protein